MRSVKSPKTSPSALAATDVFSWSPTMVLTRRNTGSSNRLVRQRGALNRAEGEKAGQRSYSENECRLLSREIRSGPEKLVDRLIAHIVCIAFDTISHTSNQPGKLGGILIEVIRRSLRGASKVADHLHATGQLIVQQPLHLISDCGGGFRCGLFGGTRCALRGFRHLGESVAALLTSLPATVLRVISLAVVWMPPRILIAHDDFLRSDIELKCRELVPRRLEDWRGEGTAVELSAVRDSRASGFDCASRANAFSTS